MSYKTGNGFTERQSQSFDETANDPNGLPLDEELKALLKKWEAPDPPHPLDLRVTDTYRGRHSAPFCRRALASSIRVPIPVAAAVALLLLGSGFLSLRSILAPASQEVVSQAPPQVQVVEVPVVQERTVTRTVYVEKIRVRKVAPNQGTSSQYYARTENNAKPAEQDEGLPGRFFTSADLSGFRPVSQMRIEVIRGTRTDED